MTYPPIDLNDAVVVITGAARGIGLATARAFHDRGSYVVLGDLDAGEALEAARSMGPRALARPVDVTDRIAVRALLSAARKWRGQEVDVLVNNAGIMLTGPFGQQSDTDAQLMVDVNLHGVAHGMREALPGMSSRGRGHIVNVASLAGRFPIPGLAMYNATKFAVVGLSAATRLEFVGSGISISTVLPSAVRTDLVAGIDYRPLPAVDAVDVAEAIVRTVRTRRPETAIPAYAGWATNIAAVSPRSLVSAARRLIGDDAALTNVDHTQRNTYLTRIHRQESE